jgi:hypothetical protein
VLICDDAGGSTWGWGEVGRDPVMWMDKDPMIWRFWMDYDPIRSAHGSARSSLNVFSWLGTFLSDCQYKTGLGCTTGDSVGVVCVEDWQTGQTGTNQD